MVNYKISLCVPEVHAVYNCKKHPFWSDTLWSWTLLKKISKDLTMFACVQVSPAQKRSLVEYNQLANWFAKNCTESVDKMVKQIIYYTNVNLKFVTLRIEKY